MAEKKNSENFFDDDYTSIIFDSVSGLLDDDDPDNSVPNDDDDGKANPEPNGDNDQGSSNVDGGNDTDQVDDNVDDVDDTNNNDNDIDTGEGSDNDGGDDSSPLVPYAKLLVDEGILPNLNLEEFDGTAEGLKEAMNKEIHSGIEAYKASLPEDVKKIIDGYEVGVPLEKLLELNKEKLNVSTIKESDIINNEELQKEIVRKYFKKTTRFSDKKIEQNIERLSDIGELEAEALSNITELKALVEEEEAKAIEAAKRQEEEYQEQLRKYWEEFDKKLEAADEIIPGLKVTKTIKQKIIANLSTAVATDQNGNPVNKIAYYRSKHPQEFELYLNYLFEVTNGFSDFSVLSKGGKKAAIAELEKAARNLDVNKTKRSVPRNVSDPDTITGIRDFLNGSR
jgi:hypothetical protein